MENTKPLAAKLRPQTLEKYIGQEHLVGPGKPLRVAIEQKHLFSFILWGPPGVGKTTLARIYAQALGVDFYELSAVSAGKEDIRKIISSSVMPGSDPASRTTDNLDSGSRKTLAGMTERGKILFLDEIHRFNKAQQDFLLPYVESGALTLIGATTENPSFEVIPALLSRCRVFTLKELTTDQMREVITHTLAVIARSKSSNDVAISPEAVDWLVGMANGDARQAITMLDNTFKLYGKITLETLKETLQSKAIRYDKAGEEHYNTISAFIKSMRASQADAAMYYLARMVEAGEDPLFIARRMVIFASEDIGLAQPTALVVANAVFQACQSIGYPECAINLAHGVAYLAQCKKDRSAYDALRAVQVDVRTHGNLPIPMSIRNAPTKLMKDIGYGKGYEMYTDETYLPEELKNKKYFNSSQNP